MSTPDISIIPQSLQKSIEDTFTSMAGKPAKILSTQAEEATVEQGSGIISLVGVKSDQLQGTIAIYFPKETYVPLMNQVLGEKQTDICKENVDGASEFLNIIYSSARVAINEKGFNFQPAIPATLKGAQLELPPGPKAKLLKLRCQCEFGPFIVIVGLAPK